MTHTTHSLEALKERLLNDYRALEAEYGSDAEKNVAEIMQLIDSAITEARLQAVAEIYRAGMDLRLQDGASSVIVGGTQLDKILNMIERNYRKEVIWNAVEELKNNTTKQEDIKNE